MKRLFWFKEKLWKSGEVVTEDDPSAVPAEESRANLVGSLLSDGLHAPVFDIDYDAELIPSSTPNHFHLYLNKRVSWAKYKRVLEAMADAGLIQRGWADSALDRGVAYLRKPGVKKGDEMVLTFNPDEIPF